VLCATFQQTSLFDEENSPRVSADLIRATRMSGGRSRQILHETWSLDVIV
jgi:hypothetical protein